MSKPIFIIKCPYSFSTEVVEDIRKTLTETLSDYHTFVIEADVKDIAFECFNDSNIQPIDLEKLREELNLKTIRNEL